eukprot:1011287-Pyramimonas_sp.AAC.1
MRSRPLQGLAQDHPEVKSMNAADDARAQCLGTIDAISRELGQVGTKLAEGFAKLELALGTSKTCLADFARALEIAVGK